MPTRAEHMFTPSALGRTKIKRTLPSCRAMRPIRSCDVSCQEGRERRGLDGWMGMTNREEQEVQRRGRENRKKRLASSEISIRIHHERGRRMAPAARDDDDDILSDSPTLPARKSERPKVDNTFRSFSVCLPEIEEESGGIQHRLFLPHFPKME